MKKVKSMINAKNSIQWRLTQSTSVIKANAHRQSAVAVKAKSSTPMKAIKMKATAAMKAKAHKLPGRYEPKAYAP